MEEKRKFPRFNVSVDVHWKKITQENERTALHISAAKDASIGGICLVLHPSIVRGDLLRLDIQLPGDRTIQAKGQVMWITNDAKVKGRTGTICEGGIQFIQITDEDRRSIERFLTSSIDLRSRK